MSTRHTDKPALAIALMTLAMVAVVGMNATVKDFAATLLRLWGDS